MAVWKHARIETCVAWTCSHQHWVRRVRGKLPGSRQRKVLLNVKARVQLFRCGSADAAVCVVESLLRGGLVIVSHDLARVNAMPERDCLVEVICH